jgi:cell division protease FtsH
MNKNKRKINWLFTALSTLFFLYLIWFILASINGETLIIPDHEIKNALEKKEFKKNDQTYKFNKNIYIEFNKQRSYVLITGKLEYTGKGVGNGIINNTFHIKFKSHWLNLSSQGEKDFWEIIINKEYKYTKFDHEPSFIQLLILNFGPSFLWISFTFVIFYFLYRSTMELNLNKDKEKLVDAKLKIVTFKNVAGLKEEKEECSEVVDYLKNPKNYIAMGARSPKGILFVGPPGTGKTLLAKAIAGESGSPFYFTSGPEFDELFVGLGASRVRKIFAKAKKSSPAIIFIDEIDAVGKKRTSFNSGHETTLNQLLVELDGFAPHQGVIVIAACNRPDVLDSALTRPGRFDRRIYFSLPDLNEREEILKLHSLNKNISSTVNFSYLASITPGLTGADLENVINEGTLIAIRKNKNVVELEDINEGIDRVIAGPAKKSKLISNRDKKITAYHEAGHALIGLALDYAPKVQKITIIRRGQTGGYTMLLPEEETLYYSRQQLLGIITGCLGGRAAEELIFGEKDITIGAHNDLNKASSYSRRMVTEYGMSSLGLVQYENYVYEDYQQKNHYLSPDTYKKIDQEVKKIIDDCFLKAKEILLKEKETLEIIARSLILLETLNKDEIDYIWKEKDIPVKAKLIEEKNKKLEELEINKKKEEDLKEKKDNTNKNNN